MSKYPLCFTGMEQADEATLKMLFVDANARLGEPFELSAEEQADVLVVDLASIYGHMTWLRAHSAGKMVIGLSNRDTSEADITLLRPITEAGFHAALAAAVEARAGRAPAANDDMPEAGIGADIDESAIEPAADAESASIHDEAPATDVPAPADTAMDAAMDTADDTTAQDADAIETVAAAAVEAATIPAPEPPRAARLADYLRAGALPGPMRLQLPGAPALVVDPRSGHYFGPAQIKPLLPYCQAEIAADDWTPASAEDAAKAGSPQSWARLLWLCALSAGERRAVDAADESRRYKLHKWPQIEREFPKHFRIATAMMKGPATLADIAQASGATTEEVADFVNASLATGFAAAEQPPAAEAEGAAKGGLLGRFKGLRGG